jgi:hypothetical protein
VLRLEQQRREPGTWGEDIEVPLIVLWPPNC